MGNRCPDCAKFVGLEQGEPTLESLDLEYTVDSPDAIMADLAEQDASAEETQHAMAQAAEMDAAVVVTGHIAASISLVLNCEQCSQELKGTTVDVDVPLPDVVLAHLRENPTHDLQVNEHGLDTTDWFTEAKAARYQRHYYAADLDAILTCTCGQEWHVPIQAAAQAGEFDEI